MSRLFRFAARYFTALVSSWYLFSFGWLKATNRALIQTINVHFGFGPRKPPESLPVIRPADLLPLDGPLELIEPVAADGNVSLLELVILARSVVLAQPACLLEIGTFDGRTTLNIAANAPEGARVLTLDLPAESPTDLDIAEGDRRYIDKPAPGARFKGSPHAGKIEQLLGDSAGYDFSALVGKVNWMFIDGAHSAEYVRNDSELARKLMAPGGWVFWHDYGVWDGVTLALNELDWGSGLVHVEGTSLAVLKT